MRIYYANEYTNQEFNTEEEALKSEKDFEEKVRGISLLKASNNERISFLKFAQDARRTDDGEFTIKRLLNRVDIGSKFFSIRCRNTPPEIVKEIVLFLTDDKRLADDCMEKKEVILIYEDEEWTEYDDRLKELEKDLEDWKNFYEMVGGE